MLIIQKGYLVIFMYEYNFESYHHAINPYLEFLIYIKTSE